jgi:hypothetical protein
MGAFAGGPWPPPSIYNGGASHPAMMGPLVANGQEQGPCSDPNIGQRHAPLLV